MQADPETGTKASAEAGDDLMNVPVGAAPSVEARPGGHDHTGPTPVHAKRGTGWWLLALVTILGVGLAAGFVVVNHKRVAQEADLQKAAQEVSDAPATVDVMAVKWAPSTRELSLPGQCQAWYETTIYARVSGYLKKWNVDIGDSVKEGQVLATIETPELDQQLASAKANVEAQRAKINLAQADMHFSDVTLARYKDAPKGIVSDIDRDQRAADFQRSQAQVAAAESDLNSAQAEVDRISAMIAFQKVTAPFAGTITQRHVDIGDLVTAGSTASTTPLFKLEQDDEIRVFTDVPEAAAPEIKDGEEAIATAKEYPGRQFIGHVARSSRSINEATKTMRVEVDIPNKDHALLPGMYVTVGFQINDPSPSLLIPASAITPRPSGPEVAVVDSDGKVTFHNVVIARDLGDSLEIKEGLKPGERVALNISDEISTGDTVKFNEVQDTATAQQPVKAPAFAANTPVPSGAAANGAAPVR